MQQKFLSCEFFLSFKSQPAKSFKSQYISGQHNFLSSKFLPLAGKFSRFSLQDLFKIPCMVTFLEENKIPVTFQQNSCQTFHTGVSLYNSITLNYCICSSKHNLYCTGVYKYFNSREHNLLAFGYRNSVSVKLYITIHSRYILYNCIYMNHTIQPIYKQQKILQCFHNCLFTLSKIAGCIYLYEYPYIDPFILLNCKQKCATYIHFM